MRRLRLRTVMVAVFVIAVLLGGGLSLHRRYVRLDWLSVQHGREAGLLENGLEGSPSRSSNEAILRRVHWHDALGEKYHRAANRPWLYGEPDPLTTSCECTWCLGRYPGGVPLASP